MAYTQDISMMMRELLKVPKDNTPTALEITRYIQSRYKINTKDDGGGKRPIGYRAYSSAAVNNPSPAKTKNHVELTEATKPLLVGSNRKMSRKVLELSPVPFRTTLVKPQIPPIRKLTTNSSNRRVSKIKEAQNQQIKSSHAGNAGHDDRLQRRTIQIKHKETPDNAQSSLWNWQKARSRIRQAMSSMIVPNVRNKLTQLSVQHKTHDVKNEMAQDIKKKQILNQIAGNEYTREPLRARELIQKLLEDNKVESQKREIAKLMETARATVMQARKSMQEDKFYHGTEQSKIGRMTS